MNAFALKHVKNALSLLASRVPRDKPELPLPDGSDPEAMRSRELFSRLLALGIDVNSSMTKAELLAAYRAKVIPSSYRGEVTNPTANPEIREAIAALGRGKQ